MVCSRNYAQVQQTRINCCNLWGTVSAFNLQQALEKMQPGPRTSQLQPMRRRASKPAYVGNYIDKLQPGSKRVCSQDNCWRSVPQSWWRMRLRPPPTASFFPTPRSRSLFSFSVSFQRATRATSTRVHTKASSAECENSHKDQHR